MLSYEAKRDERRKLPLHDALLRLPVMREPFRL